MDRITRIPAPSRRHAMFTIAATTLIAGTALPALAGGDGAERSKKKNSASSSPKSKPSSAAKPVRITQKNFHKLSDRGLRTLIAQIDAGQDTRVEGFSRRMSKNLFGMALLGRDFTVMVIREMGETSGRRARRQYLTERMEDLRRYQKFRNEGQIRGEDYSSLFLQDAGNNNIDQMYRYLRAWRNAPAEGTLKG